MKRNIYSHSHSNLLLTLTAVFTFVCTAGFSLGGTAYASTGAHKSGFMHPYIKYLNEGENPLNRAAATQFKCQAVNAPVRCYNPQQIRTAYNIQKLLNKGITGKGRTIVVIDAYQSPTIASDLQLFDKTFGLNDPKLDIIAPFGLTPFNYTDNNQVGWAGEITLDVEWAHAVAPDATIKLLLAKSNNDADLQNVLQYVVSNNLGDVISQSYGEGEACVSPASVVPAEHSSFQNAVQKRITVFASSGDAGAAQPTCDGKSYFLSASTPASDPLVTSVGATYLNATLGGSYIGEAAWNDQYGASGGGLSTLYTRPAYQNDVVSSNQRGVPDVAYNGDVNGGVLAVWSSYAANAAPRVFIFGGTSAGSPQWAGIAALADQYAGTRLGYLNKAIYDIGNSDKYAKAFHDTTVGTNTFVGTDSANNTVTVPGYDTQEGYDLVTGWGSPNVTNLVPLLKEKISDN